MNERNEWIHGSPPNSFLRRVIHTHIHDLGKRDGRTHWPLDQGIVPVRDYVERLMASGYSGGWNLELSPDRFPGENEGKSFEAFHEQRSGCQNRVPETTPGLGTYAGAKKERKAPVGVGAGLQIGPDPLPDVVPLFFQQIGQSESGRAN